MDPAIVIGAGLAGLTSAYELRKAGREVLIVESQRDIALGASHANGGMLTPSMADPWNGPGVARQLFASFGRDDSPLKLRITALPSLSIWGLRFLYGSNRKRHQRSTEAAFTLARYSVEETRKLRERLQLEYGSSSLGTLKLFRTHAAMEHSLRTANLLAPLGLRFRMLDADETVAEEPALAPIRGQIAGSLIFPDDESGDARQFCRRLAAHLESTGTVILKDIAVRRIVLRHGAVCEVRTSGQPLTTQEVVIAAGVGSVALARRAGVALPIRPAKGYSITFPVPGPAQWPLRPIVDDELHAAITPMPTSRQLRVAGTAEFAGMDVSVDMRRIRTLRASLEATYPELTRLLDEKQGVSWAGLRPMSSDGLPCVGGTEVRGLYVNAGHGHLGWTMAVGSARLLADLMSGISPAIDPSPYRVGRPWILANSRQDRRVTV